MPRLAIVAPDDRPVYEATFLPVHSGKNSVIEQLVLHSSLDMVDEKMWDTRDMYLKVVDKYNDQSISAFVTASNYRFLLLHDGRHEDGVKPFFSDLHELFVKATLNPLYVDNEPITSTTFHDKYIGIVKTGHAKPTGAVGTIYAKHYYISAHRLTNRVKRLQQKSPQESEYRNKKPEKRKFC